MTLYVRFRFGAQRTNVDNLARQLLSTFAMNRGVYASMPAYADLLIGDEVLVVEGLCGQ